MMDSQRAPGQTTRGIHIALASRQAALILDLQGSDSMEGGERAKIDDRRHALFALALSCVLMVNMNYKDVGRHEASQLALLRHLFAVHRRMRPNRQQALPLLLFVVRDYPLDGPDLAALLEIFRAYIDDAWRCASDESNDDRGQGTAYDAFRLRVVRLAHPTHHRNDFEEGVARLRATHCSDAALAASSTHGLAPADLPTYCGTLWAQVCSQQDLDVPALREALAMKRCDAIRREVANEHLSNIKTRWQASMRALRTRAGATPEDGPEISPLVDDEAPGWLRVASAASDVGTHRDQPSGFVQPPSQMSSVGNPSPPSLSAPDPAQACHTPSLISARDVAEELCLGATQALDQFEARTEQFAAVPCTAPGSDDGANAVRAQHCSDLRHSLQQLLAAKLELLLFESFDERFASGLALSPLLAGVLSTTPLSERLVGSLEQPSVVLAAVPLRHLVGTADEIVAMQTCAVLDEVLSPFDGPEGGRERGVAVTAREAEDKPPEVDSTTAAGDEWLLLDCMTCTEAANACSGSSDAAPSDMMDASMPEPLLTPAMRSVLTDRLKEHALVRVSQALAQQKKKNASTVEQAREGLVESAAAAGMLGGGLCILCGSGGVMPLAAALGGLYAGGEGGRRRALGLLKQSASLVQISGSVLSRRHVTS
uniref:GB1/RHD3-type G domain-containing protein n=1 Tax=Haptolina brevifila TaxID=156173 RepID=A0A7S2JEF9_9EUKA